jgi:hypothetical protein
MGPTGTLGATNPTAVGPGAAGGPWSYPGDSPPDEGGDGNPYSDGDGY